MIALDYKPSTGQVMNTPNRTEADVLGELESFKVNLVPESLRGKIRLTSRYELFEGRHGKPHWPENYGKVWGNEGGTGVYLHFNADDLLLYVGKAVSIGGRLGAYFEYGDQRACRIKYEPLKDSVGVRAIVLDGEPLKFLTPSLEWYLIDKLDPPVNKQHKRNNWLGPTPPIE